MSTDAGGGVNVEVACVARAGRSRPPYRGCASASDSHRPSRRAESIRALQLVFRRLATSLVRYRAGMACCRNSLSLMSGPPVSARENAEMPVIFSAEPRSTRNDGSRLFRRVRHTSPARRVRISTRPDEKRPTRPHTGSAARSRCRSHRREARPGQAGGRIDRAPGPSTDDWPDDPLSGDTTRAFR